MISASDILLTTIHVITDWPISNHMMGTSHRGPVHDRCSTVSSGHSLHRSQCRALPGSLHR
ncbi:unnamed protein product [Staurois parvus]|uniref:Uncharacterized protein n=1 Tax=Staurois parvus TaxID=386267 RepID=A0ABN9C2P5_9NEOB|nr:unnamed protein product [Staurois parvus]